MICMKCKKQFGTPEEYDAHIAVCQAKKKDVTAFEDLNEKIKKLETQNKSLKTKNTNLKKKLKALAPNDEDLGDDDNEGGDGKE